MSDIPLKNRKTNIMKKIYRRDPSKFIEYHPLYYPRNIFQIMCEIMPLPKIISSNYIDSYNPSLNMFGNYLFSLFMNKYPKQLKEIESKYNKQYAWGIIYPNGSKYYFIIEKNIQKCQKCISCYNCNHFSKNYKQKSKKSAPKYALKCVLTDKTMNGNGIKCLDLKNEIKRKEIPKYFEFEKYRDWNCLTSTSQKLIKGLTKLIKTKKIDSICYEYYMIASGKYGKQFISKEPQLFFKYFGKNSKNINKLTQVIKTIDGPIKYDALTHQKVHVLQLIDIENKGDKHYLKLGAPYFCMMRDELIKEEIKQNNNDDEVERLKNDVKTLQMAIKQLVLSSISLTKIEAIRNNVVQLTNPVNLDNYQYPQCNSPIYDTNAEDTKLEIEETYDMVLFGAYADNIDEFGIKSNKHVFVSDKKENAIKGLMNSGLLREDNLGFLIQCKLKTYDDNWIRNEFDLQRRCFMKITGQDVKCVMNKTIFNNLKILK